MSPKNTLSEQDWKKWGINFLIFSAPALLAFLLVVQIDLQTGKISKQTLIFASGAALLAFVNSLIDILKKYRSSK